MLYCLVEFLARPRCVCHLQTWKLHWIHASKLQRNSILNSSTSKNIQRPFEENLKIQLHILRHLKIQLQIQRRLKNTWRFNLKFENLWRTLEDSTSNTKKNWRFIQFIFWNQAPKPLEVSRTLIHRRFIRFKLKSPEELQHTSIWRTFEEYTKNKELLNKPET